jgi:bifunctional non-homologous end joining protein LigD
LLVGYNGPAGRLLYAGGVGSGFSERALAELYGGLQTIRRATCPFVNLPEKRPERWGLGITSSVIDPGLNIGGPFQLWTLHRWKRRGEDLVREKLTLPAQRATM